MKQKCLLEAPLTVFTALLEAPEALNSKILGYFYLHKHLGIQARCDLTEEGSVWTLGNDAQSSDG